MEDCSWDWDGLCHSFVSKLFKKGRSDWTLIFGKRDLDSCFSALGLMHVYEDKMVEVGRPVIPILLWFIRQQEDVPRTCSLAYHTTKHFSTEDESPGKAYSESNKSGNVNLWCPPQYSLVSLTNFYVITGLKRDVGGCQENPMSIVGDTEVAPRAFEELTYYLPDR